MLLPNSFTFKNFMYPDEGVGIEAPIEKLDKNEMLEFLSDDVQEETIELDNKTPVKGKPEKEEKEEEVEKEENEEAEGEEDELKELEEELKGPDEEELELIAPVRRKEILKKYPNIFKDFPYLNNAYYREQQFTEIFPNPKEAREAQEKADILDKFDADIKTGNLDKAVAAAKASGEKAFNNLVDNYLPNLAKVDKDAYHHVVGNIIKTTTIQMLQEARNSGNEDLQAAARLLNQFVFGTDKINHPTNLTQASSGDTKKEDEIARREQEFNDRQYEAAANDVSGRISNVLKSTIEANIDPKSSMTDFVKKHSVIEAQQKLVSLLTSDKRLGMLIDKLWEQSAKENFSRNSIDKIKSAYLSRAKSLLPAVIKGARIEALKASNRTVKEETTPNKGHLPVGRTTTSSNGGKSPSQKAQEIPAGMSSMEYIMKD